MQCERGGSYQGKFEQRARLNVVQEIVAVEHYRLMHFGTIKRTVGLPSRNTSKNSGFHKE